MSDDSDRIRKRLPDYFEAIGMPWHLAASFMAEFVNDDEERIGGPGTHARNLFHVAKALGSDLEAALARLAEAEKERQRWEGLARDSYSQGRSHMADLVVSTTTERATLKKEVEFQTARAEAAEAKLAAMTKYCSATSHSWADGHCRDCGKEQDPAVILYLESRREVATLTAALGRAREEAELCEGAIHRNVPHDSKYSMECTHCYLTEKMKSIRAIPPLPAPDAGEKP